MARNKSLYHIHDKLLFLSLVFMFIAGITIFVLNPLKSSAKNGNGFDQFGYNYQARIFNGLVDGADRNLDGTYWGDKTYAKDKLVMKWSKEWDDARFNGQPWTCGAWTDNEWNGKSDGSGEIWHYKISWVGPELQKSSCWREGGYPIWGQFEVTFSQGTVGNKHFWDTHAERNGYGVFK